MAFTVNKSGAQCIIAPSLKLLLDEVYLFIES